MLVHLAFLFIRRVYFGSSANYIEPADPEGGAASVPSEVEGGTKAKDYRELDTVDGQKANRRRRLSLVQVASEPNLDA